MKICPILGLLLVYWLCGCSILKNGAVGNSAYKDRITVELPNGKVEKLTVIRAFNAEELSLVKKSLRVVNYINPELQFHHYVPEVFFWAKLKEYDGLTLFSQTDIPKRIIIDYNDWLPTTNRLKNPFFILEFGKILAHECHHFVFQSKDPYTSEVTEVKLNKILAANPDLLMDVITKIQEGYFDK